MNQNQYFSKQVSILIVTKDESTGVTSTDGQLLVHYTTDQTLQFSLILVVLSLCLMAVNIFYYLYVLCTDIGSPEGIAVDWASRNIYWTDSMRDTIEVANLDTKVRRLLFDSNVLHMNYFLNIQPSMISIEFNFFPAG